MQSVAIAYAVSKVHPLGGPNQQLTRAGDLITSISLVRTQQYTTDSKKRLTKVERSQIIIENPLNEIIIGLMLG